jgi:hypothetical protein
MWVEYSRWNRLKGKLLAVENDCVTSVVTTLVAYYDVGITSIEVGDFTLTLVAPLSANNYQCVTHNV